MMMTRWYKKWSYIFLATRPNILD